MKAVHLIAVLALAAALILAACAPVAPVPPAGSDAASVPAELEPVAQGPFATLPTSVPVPADNPMTPEKVELGKMLYFDPRLSLSNVISCHSCHNLALGGTDRVPTAIGHEFQTGGRNSPTVLNAAFFNSQFWDGRAATLEDQARGPIQAGVEMALPADMAVERIAGIQGYKPYFEAAFPGEGEPVNFDNIVKAIASFERTLITPNDALDRYLRGDENALSPEAKKGMQLVQDVGCVACHMGATLSTGALVKFNHGEDTGRLKTTGNEADDHVFRVATWRNLPLTGPYFHDGSAATLEEAVEIMAKVQLDRTLTAEEQASIVAFLNSLVGEQPSVTVPILPVD